MQERAREREERGEVAERVGLHAKKKTLWDMVHSSMRLLTKTTLQDGMMCKSDLCSAG